MNDTWKNGLEERIADNEKTDEFIHYLLEMVEEENLDYLRIIRRLAENYKRAELIEFIRNTIYENNLE